MSPHRDQEGVAIRHALYRPVCTCGWRGISGCVVHGSTESQLREMTEDELYDYIKTGRRGETLIPNSGVWSAAVDRLIADGVLSESHRRAVRSESDEQEPR